MEVAGDPNQELLASLLAAFCFCGPRFSHRRLDKRKPLEDPGRPASRLPLLSANCHLVAACCYCFSPLALLRV